jgi:hypothetical protein
MFTCHLPNSQDLLHEQYEQSRILQGLACLAESDGTRLTSLCRYAEFSANGSLRFGKPASPLSRFRAEQYCGGKGPGYRQRVPGILHHARGSLLELETQVLLARKLGFFSNDQGKNLWAKAEELAKMLNGLINAIAVKTAALENEAKAND